MDKKKHCSSSSEAKKGLFAGKKPIHMLYLWKGYWMKKSMDKKKCENCTFPWGGFDPPKLMFEIFLLHILHLRNFSWWYSRPKNTHLGVSWENSYPIGKNVNEMSGWMKKSLNQNSTWKGSKMGLSSKKYLTFLPNMWAKTNHHLSLWIVLGPF